MQKNTVVYRYGVGLLLILAMALFSGCGRPGVAATGTPVDALTLDTLLNATYPSEWTAAGEVQLVDGEYHEKYDENSASELFIQFVADMYDTGDLDGDGVEDAVGVLLTLPGGSGAFLDLVAVANRGEQITPVTTFLGDRVEISDLQIVENQIILTMLEHSSDDPLCCPSMKVTQFYKLEDGELVFISEQVLKNETEAGDVETPVADTGTITTEIVEFIPAVPDETREGSCWTSSIAAYGRPDACRCSVDNQIFDPCFSLDNGVVVCDADPVSGKPGFALTLTEPLPEDEAVSEADSNPWLVVLSDGTVCGQATGTMGIVEGKPTTYYCAGGAPEQNVVLLGDLQPGEPWTAEKAALARDDTGGIELNTLQFVSIATLYR